MTADPDPVPRADQVVAPFSLAQRPCWETLAISMSRSGRAETKVRLPHSDGMPARLAAMGSHGPATAAPVAAVEAVDVAGVAVDEGAVVLGMVFPGTVVVGGVKPMRGFGEPPQAATSMPIATNVETAETDTSLPRTTNHLTAGLHVLTSRIPREELPAHCAMLPQELGTPTPPATSLASRARFRSH
jgi:hypothetical protein